MERMQTVVKHLAGSGSVSPIMASSPPPSPLTTHILDTARGGPAANVPITLYKQDANGFQLLSQKQTNQDGRCPGLLTQSQFNAGVYKLHFDTTAYFESIGVKGFYPYVEVVFQIEKPEEHYHVPLLLSPYGFSTYRGS